MTVQQAVVLGLLGLLLAYLASLIFLGLRRRRHRIAAVRRAVTRQQAARARRGLTGGTKG